MRVVLADDHVMVREGLRAVLEKAGVCVVGEASDGREAVAEVARLRPDVALVDVVMPEMNGIDAARRITNEHPGVKVIALSMSADRRYVIGMLEAGAVGYLLKNAASDELVLALTTVTRGGRYFSPEIAASIPDEALPAGARGARIHKPLSLREREVLQLLAEGKSSKEIATHLAIAVPTVETHRRQISEKVGLRSIAELTKYAIREGITSAER